MRIDKKLKKKLILNAPYVLFAYSSKIPGTD